VGGADCECLALSAAPCSPPAAILLLALSSPPAWAAGAALWARSRPGCSLPCRAPSALWVPGKASLRWPTPGGGGGCDDGWCRATRTPCAAGCSSLVLNLRFFFIPYGMVSIWMNITNGNTSPVVGASSTRQRLQAVRAPGQGPAEA